MKQGREASGRRERLAGSSRSTNGSRSSQIRREGTNPEDGTGEELADLAFHGMRSQGASRGERGARGRGVPGARSPGEADPVLTNARSAHAGRTESEDGRQEDDGTLKRTRTPREDSRNESPESRCAEEYPVAVSNGEGGAPEAREGATRLTHTSEGDGNLTRGRPHAGDRLRPPSSSSASGGSLTEPRSAATARW